MVRAVYWQKSASYQKNNFQNNSFAAQQNSDAASRRNKASQKNLLHERGGDCERGAFSSVLQEQ